MFSDCKVLTTITIPENVTVIGENAFTNCAKLESINVPASVVSIWNGAFKGCNTLDSISIPSSITIIDASVFNGCKGLQNLTVGISDEVTYNVALASNDERWGTCYISRFELADGNANVIVQAAVAAEVDSVAGLGMFSHWSDSEDSTAVKRSFILNEDITLTAIFEKDPTSIDEICTSVAKIYAYGNTIVVENADAEIHIYDSMGKLVKICGNIGNGTRNELQINRKGVYIVRVGKQVQKVIVW